MLNDRVPKASQLRISSQRHAKIINQEVLNGAASNIIGNGSSVYIYVNASNKELC